MVNIREHEQEMFILYSKHKSNYLKKTYKIYKYLNAAGLESAPKLIVFYKKF